MKLNTLKRKWWVIAILVILAFIPVAYYYFLHRINNTNQVDVKAYLNKLIVQGSDSLYYVNIGDYAVDASIDGAIITKLELGINKAKFEELKSKELLPNLLFEATADTIRIKKLQTGRLLAKNKDIVIEDVKLEGATINVYQYPNKIVKRKGLSPTKYLYQLIKPGLNNIAIKTINIEDCKLTFDPAGTLDKKNPFWKFENLDLKLHDFRIDSAAAYDSTRVLYSEYFDLTVADFKMQTPGDLYRITADKIDFDSREKISNVQQIKIKPLTDAKGFYNKKKFAVGIVNMDLPSAKFTNLDLYKLMTQNMLTADKLNLQKGSIHIFKDKTKGDPKVNKAGRYFNQILGRLKFKFIIPSIDVNKHDLKYTEINDKTGKPGDIEFDNINGQITNFTNSPELTGNRWMTLNTTSTFMKKSPLTSSLAFDMINPEAGRFKVSADLGSLEATQVNELMTHLALAEMESFQLKKLIYNGSGDDKQLTGSLKMLYSDLKVNLLRKEDGSNKIEEKKGLSFLANLIKIVDENPKNGEERSSNNLSTPRPYHKGFFALFWFNLMDNMTEIMMKGKTPESMKKNRK